MIPVNQEPLANLLILCIKTTVYCEKKERKKNVKRHKGKRARRRRGAYLKEKLRRTERNEQFNRDPGVWPE